MLDSSVSSYLRARHKTASEMERNKTTLEIDRRTSYIVLRRHLQVGYQGGCGQRCAHRWKEVHQGDMEAWVADPVLIFGWVVVSSHRTQFEG
ncbi:hypothetical protein QL285_008032 [Trifolium repens]|nr:hypothetical protein QL285_008032 [Trifolium repens]